MLKCICCIWIDKEEIKYKSWKHFWWKKLRSLKRSTCNWNIMSVKKALLITCLKIRKISEEVLKNLVFLSSLVICVTASEWDRWILSDRKHSGIRFLILRHLIIFIQNHEKNEEKNMCYKQRVKSLAPMRQPK